MNTKTDADGLSPAARTLVYSLQPPTRVLDAAAGPLVWIDLEMTGLDPRADRIMEVAVLVTDGDLRLVDDGVEFVVHLEKERLDA